MKTSSGSTAPSVRVRTVLKEASHALEHPSLGLDDLRPRFGGSCDPRCDHGLLAALNAIRKNAIACEFPIVAPDHGTIDFAAVNVQYTSGAGARTSFVYVGDKTSCALAPSNGWYYDDPKSPSTVLLCDGGCDLIKARDDGQIDVLFGCKRNEIR